MNDTKRLNLVEINPATHQWMVNKANLAGLKIGEFAGALLDMAALTWKPPAGDEGSAATRTYWHWVQMMRQKRLQAYARQAAAAYFENPTEDGADRLAAMCEDTGLNYEDLLEAAADDPFSALVAQANAGSKFGNCLAWLPTFIVEHGGSVAVRILEQAGDAEGYSMGMLNRAKKRVSMDQDSPAIRSRREGDGWYWVIGDDNVIQDEQEQDTAIDGKTTTGTGAGHKRRIGRRTVSDETAAPF